MSKSHPNGLQIKTYRFGRFTVDSPGGELQADGTRIPLAPKVAELLLAMVESGGRVVTRIELQDRLWPDTHTDRERGLNNAMNRLREALGESPGEPRIIETIPKRGYCLIPEVELVKQPVAALKSRIWIPIAAAFVLVVLLWNFVPQRRQAPAGKLAPPEYWAALRRLKLGGLKDLAEGRALLTTAVAKAPDFAPAQAALAMVLLDVTAGLDQPAASKLASEALETARKAVRLGPDSSDAHLALGLALLRSEWKLAAAASELERALWLDPSSPEAWRGKASLLLAEADTAGAVRAAERGAVLDPLSPWTQTASGRAIFYAGDFSRSAVQLEQTLQIAPDFSPAHRYLSEVYWQAGRTSDARREYVNMMRTGGSPEAEIQQAERMSSAGMEVLWRAETERLRSQRNRHGVPYKMALKYASLGENDLALECLDLAVSQKDAQMLFLRVNPVLAKLRGDPRFGRIVRRVYEQ